MGYVLKLLGGKSLKTFSCSATSGLLSSYDVHLRNLDYAKQDTTGASGGEAGVLGSFSSRKSDIGIPMHFLEV